MQELIVYVIIIVAVIMIVYRTVRKYRIIEDKNNPACIDCPLKDHCNKCIQN